MAKKAPSKHSRAARRATSPGIDTDKSLKDVKPPSESANYRPAVLAAHHGAGVTKKAKSGRKSAMSHKMRLRHERGMDRAEAVMDRTARKVEKSKGQARTVDERRRGWDDINTTVLRKSEEVKRSKKQIRADEEQAAVDRFYNLHDDDEEMEEGGDAEASTAAVVAKSAGDDEIL